MRKRGIDLLFIFVVLSFLSLAFVSSAVSCSIKLRTQCVSPNRTILGLSAATNAHAQVWNASAYGLSEYSYVLCCSGFSVSEGSSCSLGGANKILGLSSLTNAHAETPIGVSYPINVCYGSLQCIDSSNGCDYPNGEVEFLNLSSPTNAHVGTGASYQTAICCKETAHFIGASCDLTNAYWEYQSTMEGTQVAMIVNGVDCEGAAVNFTIYEDDAGTDTYMRSISGGFDSENWIAEWMDDGALSGDPEYYFVAKTFVSGDSFSSLDGTGNKLLVVSQQAEEYCLGVNICSDYSTQAECNSDPTLCDIAVSDPNCNPLYTELCSCQWDSQTGECGFVTTYEGEGEGEVTCQNGYTLCNNDETGWDYCYPGNECPEGEKADADGDGLCEIGEGCYSGDCDDGEMDSCKGGATCLEGMCYLSGQEPQNMSTCENGYTMCYNRDSGLKYCYPGSECLSGEEPLEDEDSECGVGDGCSSEDCIAGGTDKTDSCLPGSYCMNGMCYSPIGAGECIYHKTTTDDCADGQLTYSWEVEWTGAGTAPSDCVAGSRVIPCAAQIQLPFFGVYQALGVIVIIVLIYWFFVLRKKKSRAKKRK